METAEKEKVRDDKKTMNPETLERVRRFTSAGHQAIEDQLAKLDKEFAIEKILSMSAAALGIAALALARRDRRWILLSAAVTLFTAQHAISGNCLPASLLRRFGFRNSHDIEQEKLALRALRGDYDNRSIRSVLKNLS